MPYVALVQRLRDVVADQPVTETELRELIEQADGLVRALGANVAGTERRLAELAQAPDGPLAEVATELHRAGELRPRLEEARRLLAEVEVRARKLRTSWLLADSDRTLLRGS
jgi:hypothetical protein